ncbi:Spy/CpxP family protein refolding chaperone [Limobrevibacterium gyesilva]|uniref:Spy/CpxP family protein refolding chaperone n=1 Tax=Limobrevibacterium gyesilva TaxID=2991712 RepID=A0AA41YJ91_9PROT|nr:Spy/CpxP family protein refolding chaperone [Limobrevibacterium gyesilva]MCW3473246.1 Spy/CpxP family protein refolding chaperone [Limobrevibacterium gyesilva]
MITIFRLAFAAAMLGGVALAHAQTAQDHAAHLSGNSAGRVAQVAPMSPTAGQTGAMPMMDMNGMMRGGMGQMMPMMRMMPGDMAMMPFDHIEGRIAFLKAELAITDAQLPQWNAFAQALRDGAKTTQEAMAKVLQAGMPATFPARADTMLQIMSARLDAIKATTAAGKALYGVLSDAQKSIADELLLGPMGRMG